VGFIIRFEPGEIVVAKKKEPRSTKIYRKSRAPPPTPSIAMLEFGESKFKPYSEGL